MLNYCYDFYHVGAHEANRKPMLEALVLNYQPTPTDGLRNGKPSGYQLRLLEPRGAYTIDRHSAP
ncbi:MAG: hypothetical protein R3C14_33960 [Caldilineaceae bacterium]